MNELIMDHTSRMQSCPEEYGFTPEDLQALTAKEMKKGVTKDGMLAYGEWLFARAVTMGGANRRKRLASCA